MIEASILEMPDYKMGDMITVPADLLRGCREAELCLVRENRIFYWTQGTLAHIVGMKVTTNKYGRTVMAKVYRAN